MVQRQERGGGKSVRQPRLLIRAEKSRAPTSHFNMLQTNYCQHSRQIIMLCFAVCKPEASISGLGSRESLHAIHSKVEEVSCRFPEPFCSAALQDTLQTDVPDMAPASPDVETDAHDHTSTGALRGLFDAGLFDVVPSLWWVHAARPRQQTPSRDDVLHGSWGFS